MFDLWASAAGEQSCRGETQVWFTVAAISEFSTKGCVWEGAQTTQQQPNNLCRTEHTTKCHNAITKSTWAPLNTWTVAFPLTKPIYSKKSPSVLPVRHPPRDAAATPSGGPSGRQRWPRRLCALLWQLCRFTVCGTNSGRCESQIRLRFGCCARRAARAPEQPGAQDLRVAATGSLTPLLFHGEVKASRKPF